MALSIGNWIDIAQSVLIVGILVFAFSGHSTHRKHARELAEREKVIQKQRDEINRLDGMYRAIMGVDPELPLPRVVHHEGKVEVEHKEAPD